MQLMQADLRSQTPFFKFSRWVRNPFPCWFQKKWELSRCFWSHKQILESQNILFGQQHLQPQEKREGKFVFTCSCNFDIFFL